jgi:membrane-associated phospholipid phosphatase
MTTRTMRAAGMIALSLVISSGAHAQVTSPGVPPHARADADPETVTAGSDRHDVHAHALPSARSPYRLTRAREGMIFGIAAAGSLLADRVTTEHASLTADELSRMTRDLVPWFDRSATHRYSTDLIRRSEQIGTPLIFAPLALLADSRIRADWRSLGVMYLQTSLLAGAASTLSKETISRYRPYVYNTDLSYEERTEREPGKSFISSAATSAFAQAVLLATVFGDHRPDSELVPFVLAASLGAAATVGYLRYASGIHYPSDVIAGALVGAAIGYGVPWMHRAEGPGSLSVATAGEGLTLSLRFAF